MPLVELARGTPRRAAPRPRAPRRRPRRAAPRRVPASCAGTSSDGDYGKARVSAMRRVRARAPRDRSRRRRRLGRTRRSPRTSTGPAPGPIVAQPVAHGLRRARLASRAASRERRRPARAARRASRSACSPSRARRRRGGAGRGARRTRSPSKSDVDRLLAVPAGDDDRLRARARARRAPAPRPRARRRPRARAPRAGSGVTTVARGRTQLDERGLGVRVEQPRAGLGDHHRVDDDRRAGGQQVERLRDRRDRRDRAAEHPDLHRVDAHVLDDRPHLRDDHRRRDRLDGRHRDRVLRRDRGDRASCRARRSAAKAFRSAWIPAPPPESEPAIDRQTGVRSASGTAAKDGGAESGDDGARRATQGGDRCPGPARHASGATCPCALSLERERPVIGGSGEPTRPRARVDEASDDRLRGAGAAFPESATVEHRAPPPRRAPRARRATASSTE